jgi:asparagine synthase (glutamine-hydrolysing)
MPLGDAIVEAVSLRSNEGITALSGGVDSTLVAALARRECLVVGIQGSHDIRRARAAAAALGLKCFEEEIDPSEIEGV